MSVLSLDLPMIFLSFILDQHSFHKTAIKVESIAASADHGVLELECG
jgi:hypothetical protein